MDAFQSLLNHGEGKMKVSLSMFLVSLFVSILSWFILFGIGGAAGVAIGLTLAFVSIISTFVFGFTVAILYISWLDS
jgi:hypothetical protein